jgi:hypothetical protein
VNRARASIDLDGSRLVNSLEFEGSYELRSIEEQTLKFVRGDITVGAAATATIDSSIVVDGKVTQSGPGQLVLNGLADSWTVQGGHLAGNGSVRSLLVGPAATFSAGDGVGSFTIRELLDLRGTLQVDVMPHRAREAELDLVRAGQASLADTSKLQFKIRLDRNDLPDPANLLATGSYRRTVISSAMVLGNFGQSPGRGAHLDFGVFFQAVQTTPAGQTVDVSLLQAVPGDSNGRDGFGTADLVSVFSTNQYEDSIAGNSNWETGDWNHDGDFTTADLIAAFQEGYYERGPLP